MFVRFYFFSGKIFFSLRRFFREERLLKIIFFTIYLVLAFAVLEFLFEEGKNGKFEKFSDSVWWGFVTATTVGYGDKVPITLPGRILAVCLMFVGLSFISMFTAGFASKFVEKSILKTRGLAKVNFKNHLVICGISHNLTEILRELEKFSPFARVVVVGEISETRISGLKLKFNMLDLQFILGDFANEEILKKASVEKAKNVLILADESHQEQHEKADERTIMCAHSVRFLSPKVKLCAELLDGSNKSHLQRMKIDDIVVSSDYTGFILAQSAISPGIPQVLENILSTKDANAILRVRIPNNLSGKNFKEALEYFYKEKKYILLGLIKEDKEISIEEIFTDTSAIDNFIKRKFQEASKQSAKEKKEGRLKVVLNPDDNYKISEEDEAIVIGKVQLMQ